MDKTVIDSYPRYESYKDSGVDWLGEIPEGWDTKRLKYVLSERNERSKTGEEPLLMVSQKYGLVIRADYHDKATVALSNIDSKIVHKNDLVFNKLKSHLGVFYKSEIDLKGIVSPDYAVYRSKAYIEDLKFLELLFKLPLYIQQFIIRATGVAEGLIRLYTSELFDLPIPIPPLSEQKKILEFIDNKFVQIDQAINLKQQQIAKLEEYKRVVIQNAVTKGLNPDVPMKDSGIDWVEEVPAHWHVKKLKYIGKIKSGIDYKHVEVQKGYPVIGSGGQFTYASKYLYDGEAVLLGRKGTIDKPLYINGKFWTVDTMFYYICRKQFSTKFVYYCATTIPFAYFSTATALPSMAQSDLNNHKFAVPNLKEQKNIVQFLDSETSKFQMLKASYQAQIDRLKEYKTILINQAVTGRIKVI